MKNITLLMLLSALFIITGCDKGSDNNTANEVSDSLDTAVENVQEAADNAAEAIGEAAESVEESMKEATE